MKTNDRHIGGHAALFAAYLIFGLNVPVMKIALSDGHITPLAMAFFRFVGALCIFWTVSLFTPKERVPWRDKLGFFAAAIFGIFGCQFLFSVGLARTSPIDAALINTVAPIMTMLLAALFLKEPITTKKTVGVLIGVAGALALVFSHNESDRGGATLWGDIIIICSTLSFIIYLTAFKNLVERYSPVTLMKWMFLSATIISAPFCWNEVINFKISEVPSNILIYTGFVIVFATFLCYLLVPIGQQHLRPTVVSMYNYIQPIVASLVAVISGIDSWSLTATVATVLVFLGVYVVTQSKSRAEMEN